MFKLLSCNDGEGVRYMWLHVFGHSFFETPKIEIESE